VVKKSVKYYLEFSTGYYDETYHYPVAQHLNAPDILQLGYLGKFENIDCQDVKTLTRNFLRLEGQPPRINSKP
jgi:hypothetical protein